MGRWTARVLIIGLLATLVLSVGVLAQETEQKGSVSLNYWFPEVLGADTAVGMDQDWDTEWSGIGDPIWLEYPDTNGLETKVEGNIANLRVGASYWSLDSSAKLEFTTDPEVGVILPIYIHPDWVDCYHGGRVVGKGELKTSILDLELGQKGKGGVLVGGIRKVDLTRTEELSFEEEGYYGPYGQRSKDVSKSSMVGPFIGLSGQTTAGSIQLSAGAKVGLLANSLKVSTYQSDFYTAGDYGPMALFSQEIVEDYVFADTTRDLTVPVLSVDLDLAASYQITPSLELVAGYRAVLVKDAVGRIVFPDDVNESMNMLELSDLGFAGARIGLVYSF